MQNRQLYQTEKASKTRTRAHNRRLVLQVIAALEETSRATVARTTNLTPPTVSSIVRDLVDEGLVEERRRADASTVGKPAQLVGIAGGRYQIACLDLSGPTFSGAVIDLNGTVLHTESGAGADLNGGAATAATRDLAEALVNRMTAPERRVCVATPGVVDGEGTVRRAAFFAWTDEPLGPDLEAHFGMPSFVVNDSHALALAEYAKLEEPVDNLIAVRVARGVSAGIILQGAPYVGDGFGAGEIGFLLPSATSGQHSSALSIARLAEQLGSTSDSESWDLTAAVEQASAGDRAKIATTTGTELGRALAALVGVLDVHTIKLDPTIASLGPELLEAASATLTTSVVDSIAAQVEVQYGLAGPDAVLRGAALAVTHRDLGLV